LRAASNADPYLGRRMAHGIEWRKG
jgi:hypothetical protein